MAGAWQINYPSPSSGAGIGAIFGAAMSAKRRKDEQAQKLAEREADRAAKAQEAERNSTANRERYFAQLLQARPQDADQIARAAKAQGVNIGSIMTPEMTQQARGLGIEIEDATTPEQAAISLGGRASSVLGAPKPDEMRRPGSLEEKLLQEGLNPGSPEWYARARQLNNPSGGININMGGKPLPAASVIDLSSADASLVALDNLLGKFNDAFPQADSVIGRASALIGSKIPLADTEASRFENLANMTTQIVGKALEGGVLKEADFGRYKTEFMIKPGDSLNTAKWKTEQLKTLIAQRTQEARRQLQAAGYNAPSADRRPEPTDADIDAALAGGQ